MKKPIAISLSPNSQKDDLLLVFKLLLSPIRWFDFTETEKLEKKFSATFGKGYKALAVNSGRSALYLILKALNIRQGDEVILQALTCVAVPNSIIWTGARPIYADVGKDYNISPHDLGEKISENTKAIIVQHSFGIPADINSIKKIIQEKKKKLFLIEDCALALGCKYKGKKVGTLGDISFFSFGRDKVISSVFGGMILCKNNRLYKILKSERDKLAYPLPTWLLQQLLHPLVFGLALPLYNLGFGKITLGKGIIYFSQKLGIISKAVYKMEESGKKPKVFPLKMPGALAVLALNQLGKLGIYNSHREKVAKLYAQKLSKLKLELPLNRLGATWVRYPILSQRSSEIYQKMKLKGVLLGDWYRQCVVPVRDLSIVGYSKGSCPAAEKMAGNILNLPTYPNLSLKDAEKVVNLLKNEFTKR